MVSNGISFHRVETNKIIPKSSDKHHNMSLVVRKPVFGVSDQVPHKPGCAFTEDDLRLVISYLDGLYCPCSENKGADQLRGHCEADLRLCFQMCKNPVFSRRGSYLVLLINLPEGLSNLLTHPN